MGVDNGQQPRYIAIRKWRCLTAEVAAMTTLERLRKEAGLSMTALAKAAGISSSYISRLERGQRSRPTVPTAVRICRALEAALGRPVRVDEVFGDPDQRHVA